MKKLIWVLCVLVILLSIIAYQEASEEPFALSSDVITDVTKLDPTKQYIIGSLNSTVNSVLSPPAFGGQACDTYPSKIYIEYRMGQNIGSPALCPQQLLEAGVNIDGYYWYKPPSFSTPIQLFTRFNMADNRPWVLVHSSLPKDRKFVAPLAIRDDTNSEGGAAVGVYNNSMVTFLLRTSAYTSINYSDTLNMWNPNPIGSSWYRVTFTFNPNSAIHLVVFNFIADGTHDPNTIQIRDTWGDSGVLLGQANYNCWGSTRVSVPLTRAFNGTKLYINFGRPSSGWQVFARGVEFFTNADNWDTAINMNIPYDGLLMQSEDGTNKSWAYPSLQGLFNTNTTPSQAFMGNREGFKTLIGTNGGHGLYNGFNLGGRCGWAFIQGSIGAGYNSIGCGGNTNYTSTPNVTGAFPYAALWGANTGSAYTSGIITFGGYTTIPVQTWIWWESRNMTGVVQSNPATSPQQLQDIGYRVDGFYWYKSAKMTTPIRLYTRFNMVDNRAWVLAMSTITSKWTPLNHANNPPGSVLPFNGIFLQDFDYTNGIPVFTPPSNGVWSYFSTQRMFNNAENATTTVLTQGGNRSGMRVFINGAGAHGFYNTGQRPCAWSTSDNAYGAGWTSGLGCGGGDPSNWTWGRGQVGNNNYNIGTKDNRLWQTWLFWQDTNSDAVCKLNDNDGNPTNVYTVDPGNGSRDLVYGNIYRWSNCSESTYDWNDDFYDYGQSTTYYYRPFNKRTDPEALTAVPSFNNGLTCTQQVASLPVNNKEYSYYKNTYNQQYCCSETRYDNGNTYSSC